jgi:predicted DCC family thiol-disulfide oxidoreductase YuxK
MTNFRLQNSRYSNEKNTYTYFEGDCILCILLNRTVIYINAMNRVKFKAICNVCKRRWLSDSRQQLTLLSKITYYYDDTRII